MITRRVLEAIANNLGGREFTRFAAAVNTVDAAVGVTVSLHALAADGNSPDLIENDKVDWIIGTLDDARCVAGMESEEAAEWWREEYGEHEKDY